MRGLLPSIVFSNLAVLEKKIYRFLSSRCEKKKGRNCEKQEQLKGVNWGPLPGSTASDDALNQKYLLSCCSIVVVVFTSLSQGQKVYHMEIHRT